MSRAGTGEVADLLVRLTLDRPATLGAGRLLCVDGRAGSGKSTLGEAVRQAAASCCGVALLHMDDLYEGWGGLHDTPPRVAENLLRPLSEGRPGRWQRYDWLAGRFADWRTEEPVDLLVLEGVGSGACGYADLITTLVWVEAPRDLRIRRGIARDGEQVRENWLAWMAEEDRLFAAERTRERADVLVDGTGEEGESVLVRTVP